MDIPYPLYFSRYRKTREKARKILENLEEIHIPQGGKDPAPLPPVAPPSSSRKGLYLLLGLGGFLLLLFGGYVYLRTPVPRAPLKYSFLYGEAQVSSKDIVFYRSQGDEQTIEQGKEHRISTEKKNAVFYLSKICLVELRGDSQLELSWSPQKVRLRLVQGEVFLKVESPLELSLGQRDLSCFRGMGVFSYGESGTQFQLFDGDFRTSGGRSFAVPASHIERGSQMVSVRGTSLPTWVIRVKGIPWEKIGSPGREVSFGPSQPDRPQKKTPTKPPIINKPEARPPYPYFEPQWKREMRKLLSLKKVSLDMAQGTVETLVAEVAGQTGLKISLDSSLPFEVRQKNLSKIKWDKKPLQFVLQWISGQIPSVHLELDQQQVWLALESYSPQLERGERVLLVFDSLREMVKLSRKKVVAVEELLSSKLASLDAKELPLSKAIQLLSKSYPHVIIVKKGGQKEITYQAFNSPLKDILEGILSSGGLKYAPQGADGVLVITDEAEASSLWEKYRQQANLQKEVLGQEELLRKNLLSSRIKVEIQNQEPWKVCQWVSQKTGVAIFLDQRAWQGGNRINLEGTFSLEDVLKEVWRNTGVQTRAMDPYLFSKICRPSHREIEIQRGLYLFFP